jgi:hypothetical protein
MAAIQGDIPASALADLQALMDNLLNDISELSSKSNEYRMASLDLRILESFYSIVKESDFLARLEYNL